MGDPLQCMWIWRLCWLLCMKGCRLIITYKLKAHFLSGYSGTRLLCLAWSQPLCLLVSSFHCIEVWNLPWTIFGQSLWFDAALVNMLMPCVLAFEQRFRRLEIIIFSLPMHSDALLHLVRIGAPSNYRTLSCIIMKELRYYYLRVSGFSLIGFRGRCRNLEIRWGTDHLKTASTIATSIVHAKLN